MVIKEMGPIDSPETSVLSQPALYNIPEGDIIQANHSKSLRFRIQEMKEI